MGKNSCVTPKHKRLASERETGARACGRRTCEHAGIISAPFCLQVPGVALQKNKSGKNEHVGIISAPFCKQVPGVACGRHKFSNVLCIVPLFNKKKKLGHRLLIASPRCSPLQKLSKESLKKSVP
jgi:hypothetical protein